MAETAKTSNQPYKLDDQIGYLLRQASQKHAAIFQAHMVHKLTPTQFSALIRIHEHGQCSQNRLGRLASMDVATIKGVVDRLLQKDLIATSPDPNDRRRVLITLTQSGGAILEELFAAGHAISAETLDPLTISEIHALINILRKLG